MIKVSKDESGINHVKCYVTEFTDSMGYCEYKIPFFAKGDYVKTEAMIIGGQFHKEAEDFDRETAITEPLTKMELETKTEDIEFVREDISTIFIHDFNFPKGKTRLTLSGRADNVYRSEETLVISDDKHTNRPEKHDNRTKPYNDNLLQVLTYLYSKFDLGDSFGGWSEIPHKAKSYKINIIDQKTKATYKTYQEIVSKKHEEFLFDYASLFTQKCLQWDALKHHNMKAKCKPCGYFGRCEHELR